jgi:signal peptidase II
VKLRNVVFIILLILIADQALKFWVKTSMFYHEERFVLGSWFRLYFIENEGMAWGTKIPGEYGKLILTSFRILAIFGIGYWLYDASTKHSSRYLMVAIALIFAGAAGNIIDSVFYGVIFDESTRFHVAAFSPDQPYGTWFHGKVVDMLYFPIYEGTFPEWLPIWGGEPFKFFNAIFNIADTAISVGLVVLLLFQRRLLGKEEERAV